MLRRRPIARAAVRTTAVVGTAAVVGGAMSRRGQQQAPPPQEAPAPEVQYVEAPAAPVGPSPDAIEQLKELAGLKDQGILTEEEFAAQKAKILGA
jgi:hypothetical protein